ncbi:Uncharacterised protein [Rikenella microfusus]|uniref:Uncharacterized protein n=1 Tax=Rikenella microfusus TaxID=28139 RepID=A0A379MU94_9BACT|nr:Uncharacterised protein [Rikenella microfusus]
METEYCKQYWPILNLPNWASIHQLEMKQLQTLLILKMPQYVLLP